MLDRSITMTLACKYVKYCQCLDISVIMRSVWVLGLGRSVRDFRLIISWAIWVLSGWSQVLLTGTESLPTLVRVLLSGRLFM